MKNNPHEKGFRNIHIQSVPPGAPPKPNDNWPYQRKPNNGNDPQYGIRSPKFERHLYIMRDQLMYDIDAQISIVAMSRRKEDGTEDDKFSSATTTFKAQFDRWITEAVGIAKGVMSAFVLEKFKTTDTNSVKDTDEDEITLLMPEWYDDTVFPQLTNAFHSYVVNHTLARFFALTLTSKDPVTVDKQQEELDALHDVKKYVNSNKPGTIHKIQKPF